MSANPNTPTSAPDGSPATTTSGPQYLTAEDLKPAFQRIGAALADIQQSVKAPPPAPAKPAGAPADLLFADPDGYITAKAREAATQLIREGVSPVTLANVRANRTTLVAAAAQALDAEWGAGAFNTHLRAGVDEILDACGPDKQADPDTLATVVRQVVGTNVQSLIAHKAKLASEAAAATKDEPPEYLPPGARIHRIVRTNALTSEARGVLNEWNQGGGAPITDAEYLDAARRGNKASDWKDAFTKKGAA